MNSVWQRSIKQGIAANVIEDGERFGMHGLKHRGITDTGGNTDDKQQPGRWWSTTTTRWRPWTWPESV